MSKLYTFENGSINSHSGTGRGLEIRRLSSRSALGRKELVSFGHLFSLWKTYFTGLLFWGKQETGVLCMFTTLIQIDRSRITLQ